MKTSGIVLIMQTKKEKYVMLWDNNWIIPNMYSFQKHVRNFFQYVVKIIAKHD